MIFVRRYSQTDILLTERHRMERPLLWLVWISALMFSMVDGNMFYLGLLTAFTSLSYFATLRNLEICLDRWMVNLAAIAATVWVIMEHKIFGQRIIISIGHYTMLIQICKIFERKRPFDYILTQLLAMILVVISAMLCALMWLAIMVIGYVFLACYVAMVFTLKRGLDRAAENTLPTEQSPIDPKKLAWNAVRDWPGKPLRQVMFSLGCMSLFMGGLAFLLAPRTAKGILSAINSPEPLASMQEKVMPLGKPREIYLSKRQVMAVQVLTNNTPGPTKSFSSQYLRENVLTKYSRSSWKADDGNFIRKSLPEIMNLLSKMTSKLVIHKITLFPGFQGGLPAPYPTMMLVLGQPEKVTVTRDLIYSSDGPDNPFSRRHYETYSFGEPFTASQVGMIRLLTNWFYMPPNPATRITLREEDKKRILELADQWTGDLLKQRDALPKFQRDRLNIKIASRLAAKLGERCSYTLDLRDADPNRDAIVDFLFYMKKGHCEYFASTLGVMCCLLDIPARVAIGYHFDDYDRSSKSYAVRECDAHAWCEVYSRDSNWMIVDPTPASAVHTSESGMQWWAKLKAKWTSMQYWWYENIIGFDSDYQEHMKQNLQEKSENAFNQLANLGKRLWNSLINLISKGEVDELLKKAFLWFLVVSGGLVALKITQIMLMNKLLARTPQGQALMRRVKSLYRIMELAQRKGLPCRQETTLREWCAQAVEKFNLPEEPLRELVELQNSWRWGNRKPTPEELEKATAAAKTIEEFLKSA